MYKIYYDNDLVYIGRTKQALNDRLRGHFFAAPLHRTIFVSLVSKIEYMEFKTEADMFLYEIYLINKFKPPLNVDDKAPDELTIELPDLEFIEYDCPLLPKWKTLVEAKDIAEEEKRKFKQSEKKAAMDALDMMRKKRRMGEITEDEYFEFKERCLTEAFS